MSYLDILYILKELKINFLYLTDINFKKLRINDNKIIFKKFDVVNQNIESISKKKYI